MAEWRSSRAAGQSPGLAGLGDASGQLLANGSGQLFVFSVSTGLEFGVDEVVVNGDLELATLIWNQGHGELLGELLEEPLCHAHGTVGVVSSAAEDDRHMHCGR